jgi:hypothetical protein
LLAEQAGRPAKQLDAEVAFVKESTYARVLEIPDGGTILVPVHYRSASAVANERWWVLSITPRIYIEEEEQAIREGALAGVHPVLIADILKNPRLKAMREIYGTVDDKRFALVDGDGGAWPQKPGPEIAGHTVAPPDRAGKRLLGIRLDKYEEPQKEHAASILTVTLINAGGIANGAAVGGCVIRYFVRQHEKGWTVELLD